MVIWFEKSNSKEKKMAVLFGMAWYRQHLISFGHDLSRFYLWYIFWVMTYNIQSCNTENYLWFTQSMSHTSFLEMKFGIFFFTLNGDHREWKKVRGWGMLIHFNFFIRLELIKQIYLKDETPTGLYPYVNFVHSI